MDITTIGGVGLAIVAILGGQALEGGHVGSILQATAFIIVMGGTIGATMVAYPLKDFIKGLKMASMAIKNAPDEIDSLIVQLVELANVARRDGVLALEGKLAEIKDPFFNSALGFVVDGVDARVVRDALGAKIEAWAEEQGVAAKLFETAGGFAPTVGILGAVLGLIHVMENLADPSKLGGGIATAFVATVYGVGSANILFLPMASKIKRKLGLERERQTLIAEGILSIQEGLNPRVLESKLRAILGGHGENSHGDKK
jgi:chemotaxis protein MotA